jgi:hypothetical protein
MLKRFKMVTLIFALGVFLSFLTTAIADQASSGTKDLGTVNGHHYGANGLISTDYGVEGYSVITCTDGAVPTGYMGISSYVYNSAGTCVRYSPWSYNTSSVQSIGTSTSRYYVSGTYYRSKGSCKMYNGSNYTEKPSNYTPYLYY